MPSPASRDANWVDGLRGIAAFTVVTGHLCTAFIPFIHAPALGEDESSHILQLPFFRLLVSERAAVALFFLITGYVNAVGPLAKAKAGNTATAFNGIARSALARSGRLMLPTIIATTLSWFFAQVGLYNMGRHIDATWIRQGWHDREPTLVGAVQKLMHANVLTWTVGWDEYDGTQWTLMLFLQGAFLVYMTIVATMLLTPRARRIILVVLYCYSWLGGQAVKSMNIFWGIFIAELQTSYGSPATSLVPKPFALITILLGLFFSGFPQDAPNWAPWSRHMDTFMLNFIPADTDVRRYWDSLGASVFLTGLFFSGPARRFLSLPLFNFMGRVSFPVYLIHNLLMKTVLVWMIFLPSYLNPKFNEDGSQKDLERGGLLQFAVCIPAFYLLVYRLADLWTKWVDPLCAAFTDWMVRWATGEHPVALAGMPIMKEKDGKLLG